ncbi:HTH-type transcriptional regulator HdfR [Streptomyces sp. enrichment culture]
MSDPYPAPVDLDLRLVQCFTVVAEHQHFGRAAEALHTTQPSLSRQIRRLEQQVGARLLDRTTHGTRLSEAGETRLPGQGPARAPWHRTRLHRGGCRPRGPAARRRRGDGPHPGRGPAQQHHHRLHQGAAHHAGRARPARPQPRRRGPHPPARLERLARRIAGTPRRRGGDTPATGHRPAARHRPVRRAAGAGRAAGPPAGRQGVGHPRRHRRRADPARTPVRPAAQRLLAARPPARRAAHARRPPGRSPRGQARTHRRWTGAVDYASLTTVPAPPLATRTGDYRLVTAFRHRPPPQHRPAARDRTEPGRPRHPHRRPQPPGHRIPQACRNAAHRRTGHGGGQRTSSRTFPRARRWSSSSSACDAWSSG